MLPVEKIFQAVPQEVPQERFSRQTVSSPLPLPQELKIYLQSQTDWHSKKTPQIQVQIAGVGQCLVWPENFYTHTPGPGAQPHVLPSAAGGTPPL